MPALAAGFLGWVAYLGAANAGVPLSIIVKQYGEAPMLPVPPKPRFDLKA